MNRVQVYQLILNADNLQKVLNLEKNHIDLHSFEDTLFKKSVDANRFQIVEFLLNRSTDIHVGGDYALMSAVDNKNEDMIRFLVERGADINASDNYPLAHSILYSQRDLINFFISKGANIPTGSDKKDLDIPNTVFYQIATRDGDINTVQNYILKLDVLADLYPGIYLAAENGHADVLKLLLDTISIDQDGLEELLKISSENGNEKVVELILDKLHSLEVYTFDEDDGDVFESPLVLAATNGHFKVVKLLISNNKKYGIENDMDMFFALTVASGNGDFYMVKLILDNFPKYPNSLPGFGDLDEDPLFVASQSGYLPIVRLLLKRGAIIDFDIDLQVNNVETKVLLKLHKLKLEIKKSMDKKQFVWQDLCSQLNQEGTDILIGFSELLEIPIEKGVTKRQVCLLLSRKMYDSVIDCQDDNLLGDSLNTLPGWRILKINGKCWDILDLQQILKSGETRDPYTRQELPIAFINDRLNILEKLSKKPVGQDETLFDKITQNPIYTSDQLLLRNIGILFRNFPYSITPTVITNATDSGIDNMISKLFETSANNILQVSPNVVRELKKRVGKDKKLFLVNVLTPLVDNDNINILLYNAFISFFLKRKREQGEEQGEQQEDLFETIISQ
jgi:ankyrin repeat protein